MSGSDRPSPIERSPIELGSDEDWKNRVKAEDAALDQQFHQRDQKSDEGTATAPEEGAASEKTSPDVERASQRAPKLPEGTFSGLLGMLSTQAMVSLGIIADPATRKPNPQIPLARYFIDLIAVLEHATKGNLSQEEAALLDETLHSLRMTYVQRSKDTK